MKAFSVAVVLCAMMLVAVGCNDDSPFNKDNGEREVANLVKMNSLMKYDPSEITIQTGEAVTWKNTSMVKHTVTADATLAKKPEHVQLPPGAAPFNSGDIGPGKTYGHTFTVPGTYKYFCIPHESMGMVGTVIVQEPVKPMTPSPARPVAPPAEPVTPPARQY